MLNVSMMRCAKCSEWAQYRVRKPQRDDKGKIQSWELISVLCGTHKKEQEAMEENKDLKFDFVGAMPCR